MAELWDVYDKDRKPVGRKMERGKPIMEGDYHLVVQIWIHNKEGRWLISKRSPDKESYPNKWECTGGAVVAGEDTFIGSLREVKEELGIDLDPNKGRLFRSYQWSNSFQDVYVYEHDCDIEDVVYQEGETCDAKWATEQDIFDMMETGEFMPMRHVHYCRELFDEYRGEAVFGVSSDIKAWMELVRSVKDEFPGLETQDAVKEHAALVQRFMDKRQAICVRDKGKIAGVLLFSRSRNMICCLAVGKAYRRCGVASRLLERALNELDKTRDIMVSTFREGDEKGIAPRALYKKFGFVPDELTIEFGYPNQVFVKKA